MTRTGSRRWRFAGQIAGVGTSGGTRVVVGHWPDSPFGTFADVMVERPDGLRLLLAPTQQVAEFVSATYVFDEVRLTAVTITASREQWRVEAGPLRLVLAVGGRTPLGWLLRGIPRSLAAHARWTLRSASGSAPRSRPRPSRPS
jgi:hypothetical protein